MAYPMLREASNAAEVNARSPSYGNGLALEVALAICMALQLRLDLACEYW